MKRTPIDPADIRVGDLVERRCFDHHFILACYAVAATVREVTS